MARLDKLNIDTVVNINLSKSLTDLWNSKVFEAQTCEGGIW